MFYIAFGKGHLIKGPTFLWLISNNSGFFFRIEPARTCSDWPEKDQLYNSSMKKMIFTVYLFNQVCEAKAKQVCPNYWEMSKLGAQANIYLLPGSLYFVSWMKIKTQTLEKTDWCKISTFGKNSLDIFDKPFFQFIVLWSFFCDYTKQEGHWHM